MSTTNNPYAEAEQKGLEVIYTQLPPGIDGLYTGKEILIRPRLPTRYEICTLWHELGHHHYGLTHIPNHMSSKLEHRCDIYAAQRLVDPNELRTLSLIYPEEPSRVAYELGITPRLLNAYLKENPIRQAA